MRAFFPITNPLRRSKQQGRMGVLLLAFATILVLYSLKTIPCPASISSTMLNTSNGSKRWNVEYHLDENKNSILQERWNFASELSNFTTSTYREGSLQKVETWFIFSVATSVMGAKLSANLCASLLTHGVTKCAMLGLKAEALQWWADNKGSLPRNAHHFDGTHFYQWCYDWNQREHYQAALETYLQGMGPISLETYRHIQALSLVRNFVFVDMLHEGVNSWMIDSDVVFPLDPKGMFLDQKVDCVYMFNAGNFPQTPENPYSYPFLPNGGHGTVNNGVVSSRSTPSTLKLWEKNMNGVLNHVIGDPQHPHNQLLFALGLRLEKTSVDGYPDLEGDYGYFEGNLEIYVNRSDALPLRIRTVMTGSAASSNLADINQHAAIHAVGVGGMGSGQNPKCEFFKKIGTWYIEASCDDQ